MLSSDVIVKIYKNDNQNKSVMIIAWIYAIKLFKILLNDDSLIELLNKKKLN